MASDPEILEIRDERIGLTAYLVVATPARSICFGGMRVDEGVTKELVVDLAEAMALKLAPHETIVGAAKAGIRGSPRDPRLPAWIRGFAEAAKHELGQRTVLGKDMGATDEMLALLYRSVGRSQLALGVPDAPADATLAGLQGYRKDMTALGVLWSAIEVLGDALRGARVLVQGFGVVGTGVLRRFVEAGVRIVGVSDKDISVLAHDGDTLPLEALLDARVGASFDAARVRCGRIGATAELLSQPADVLVLAAGSRLVDAEVARSIRCPVIIEGANVALLPDARRILHAAGATVVPDVVASSTSAALVASQLASGNSVAPDEVWQRIRSALVGALRRTLQVSRAEDVDTRVAFERIHGQAAGLRRASDAVELWFHERATHYVVAQVLHQLGDLGVLARLADGPQSAAGLAQALGLDARVLGTLLQYLAAVDEILIEDDEGRYAWSSFGEAVLRRYSRVEDGVRTINMFGVRVGSYGPIWSALGELARVRSEGERPIVQRRGAEAARTVFALAPRLWQSLAATLRAGDYGAALEIGVSTGLPKLVARDFPGLAVGGIDRSAEALAQAAELTAVADASWILGDFFAPQTWPEPPAERGLFYTVHLHELLARGAEPTRKALAAIRARFPGWDVLAFEQPRLGREDRSEVSRVEWLYAHSNVLIHHVIGNGVVARHDEWLALFEQAGYRVLSADDAHYLGYRAYRVGT